MNAMQIINQVMSDRRLLQNPIISNAIGMYRSNNAQGLQNLAENLCRERGMSVNDIRKRLGI